MRDFGAEKMWTPAGSRPHVYLTPAPGDDLRALCDTLTAHPGPLERWQPNWREFTHALAPEFWHITLAWLNIPTHWTPPGSWDALKRTLTTDLAGVAPVALTPVRVETTTHGVLMWIAATPELLALAEAAGQAMRSVYGADAPVTVEDHPHIALAYGCAIVDTPPLSITPAPVTDTARNVQLVDCDTFGPAGLSWDTGTARRISLAVEPDQQRGALPGPNT